MGYKLSDDDKEIILELYSSHKYTQRELSKKMQIPEGLIAAYIRSMMQPHRYQPNEPINFSTSNAILSDWRNGIKKNSWSLRYKPSKAELGRKYKVHRTTVARIIKAERKTMSDGLVRAHRARRHKDKVQRARNRKWIDKRRTGFVSRPGAEPEQILSLDRKEIKPRDRKNYRIKKSSAIMLINAAAKGMPRDQLLRDYRITEGLLDMCLRHGVEIKQGKPIE